MTAAEPASALSGILNVRKPTGMTSHDVVARVRRLIGVKRVGHAGTLDPAADGVLLVCIGAATRVSEYLMDGIKSYRAVIRLGATSATDDSEGPITQSAELITVDLDRLRQIIPRFLGEIEQIPPRFSAIKVSGRKLYERARAGEDFIPAVRNVRIDAIDIVEWCPPDLTVDVTCAKGTYIRSLARDLGAALETGGYLFALTRTACGDFALDASVSIDDIERAVECGTVSTLLQPLDLALARWPAIILADPDAGRVAHGESWTGECPGTSDRARAYDRRGNLIALLERDGNAGCWRPSKVFYGVIEHGAA